MVGNIPNYTKMDILRCFLRFSKNTGRQELARDLELGEGTIRTILNTLKSRDILDSTKKGHFLSKKGKELINKIYDSISLPRYITSTNLYPAFKKIAFIVRGVSILSELYKLRDIAVKNGAEGAIILRFNDGKLNAPGFDLDKGYEGLLTNFDFQNNDVLIVSFSNSRRNAENGALAIAVELSGILKKFINEF